MPATKTPPEAEVPKETIKEEAPAVTSETLQALLKEQAELFRKEIEALKADRAIPTVVEKPMEIVNEVFVPVKKPRKIKYKISAYEPDDAVINGEVIPGKKIVGEFKYTSQIAMVHDLYRTGFEYDKLDIYQDLTEEQLLSYQKDVREARQYVEKIRNISLSEQNFPFWEKQEFKVDNLTTEYDTDNIESLIMYYNILGGSYPGIARNLEDAQKREMLLYLDTQGQEAKSKTKYSSERKKAYSILQNIEDTWKRKDILFLIYALDTKRNHGYTLETPIEVLTDELSEFIEGVDTTTQKKQRPQLFRDAVQRMSTDGNRMKAEGLIRAAMYYNVVKENRQDKTLTIYSNGHVMGHNIKESADYLISAANEDDLAVISAAVNSKWTD